MTNQGQASKDSLRKHFEQRAPGYASAVRTYTDAKLAELCWEVLPKKEFQSILDLGAGQGHFTYLLSPHFPNKTIFFDISSQMLNEGVQRGIIPKNKIVIGDAEEGLPFPDETFDLVLCRYAWHDFQNQEFVAKEIARVLVEKGVFLLVDMCPFPEASPYVDLYNKIHSLKTKLPTNIITWKRLLEMMEKVNLKLLDSRWYTSKVRLQDWVIEGQITKEEATLIRGKIEEHREEFARIISIHLDPGTDEILFYFPVVICSFSKLKKRK